MPHLDSFLDVIQQVHGDQSYVAPGKGRRRRHNGNGLPTGLPCDFMFATGIECSNPTIHGGRTRRDLLAECGHYQHWRKDFELVKELGLRVLRYHLPYYSTHLGPDRYDWSFADEVLPALRDMGITPILDLLHFGVPDWLGDFQNPEFPARFAEYAGAVAARYPWIRYYTPVNEMYVTARFSAKLGLWNEQLKSDAGFMTALKHLVAAAILASHEIASVCPHAIMVQSESAEYTHEARAVGTREIQLWNKIRFLALDLLYAHPPDAEVCLFAFDNGLTRQEYEWLMAGEPPGHQVVGLDYYGRNELLVKPDGTTCQAEDVLGWHLISHDYYNRYRKPMMHTETNVFDANQAPNWLWKQWANILRMRAEGTSVLGFTWYSLIDQIDWHIGLAECEHRVNECGLYDLDRRPRPVAEAYRQLLHEFGQIPVVPHGEFLEISTRSSDRRSDPEVTKHFPQPLGDWRAA